MPPNSTVSDKPVCVSDSFHFSSFYHPSSASLAGLDQSAARPTTDDDDSIAGAGLNGVRSRNSSVGSELDAADQPVLKVRLL